MTTEEKNWSELLEKIYQLYTQTPQDISVVRQYCEVLYQLRRFEDVFSVITNIEDRDLMFSTLKHFCMRLYNEGFHQEALKISHKLIDYCHIDKDFLLIIGVVNYHFKIYEVAERLLNTYIDLGGTDKQAFLYLADIAHSVKKDALTAYTYYQKSLGISDKYDKLAYHHLGMQCFALGDYKEAIKYFKSANDYKYKNIEGYFSEGVSYFFTGDYKSAYSSMKKVVEIFGDYPPADFMIEYLKSSDMTQRLKDFISSKTNAVELAQRTALSLKPYVKELQDKIFCKRDKIWESTNFYNDLDGIILYSLIRLLKPKHVIEFSPYRGYSTVFIYEALRNHVDNFTFNTFDLGECAEFTDMMRLFDINLKVILGDAIYTVPKYIKENNLVDKIGFCHVDSLHEYDFAKRYTEEIFPLLGDNCVIAIHDMYFIPDKLQIPFNHYSDISYRNICPNPASIGEAKAIREFFKQRDSYMLFSTNRLFGGLGHCAIPLPLNIDLLTSLDMDVLYFLEKSGYWTQAPMLLIAIPKKIYDKFEPLHSLLLIK